MAKITKDYRGLTRLIAKARRSHYQSVDVGFFEDAFYTEGDGTTTQVAQVAEWLEHGVQDGIPRPFFTDTVEAFTKRMRRSPGEFTSLAHAFLDYGFMRGISVRDALMEHGEYLKGRIVGKIENNSYPRNRDKWLDYKSMVGAPTKPLMFTTQMMASVEVRWRGR